MSKRRPLPDAERERLDTLVFEKVADGSRWTVKGEQRISTPTGVEIHLRLVNVESGVVETRYPQEFRRQVDRGVFVPVAGDSDAA